jgi:ribose-phosphate pyrophosphokinase
MELLVMIDAMKRASAGRVTAVIPYFGYARQDRKAKSRDPISAKLVANLITEAGADRVLTMDLHANQIQGFFDIPVDNLNGAPLFARHYIQRFGKGNEDFMVVSPDVGSVARARAFALKMELNMAIVDKRREKANQSEVMNIIGSVEGKNVILLDDMVDTAGSLCGAAKALREIGGAKEVYACASHGVLSGPAIDRINDSCIKELTLLDTIPYPADKPRCDKIRYLSVAPVFAEAIERIYEEVSISSLFD